MNGAIILATLALALSLGLDALSVAIGIGLKGISPGAKLRVGLAFAGFQVLMPLIGLLAGSLLSQRLEDVVAYGGFALLIGLGLHMLWESREAGPGIAGVDEPARMGDNHEPGGPSPDLTGGWRLILAAISVSLDALGAGFSLVATGLPIIPALAAIGVAAFLMTFAGLQFGRLLGRKVEHRSEQAAGALLVLLGIGFAARRLLGS